VWIGGFLAKMNPDGSVVSILVGNFRNSYEQSATSLGAIFQSHNDDPPACRVSLILECGNAGFCPPTGNAHGRTTGAPANRFPSPNGARKTRVSCPRATSTAPPPSRASHSTKRRAGRRGEEKRPLSGAPQTRKPRPMGLDAQKMTAIIAWLKSLAGSAHTSEIHSAA
jgi:hypothetical protein